MQCCSCRSITGLWDLKVYYMTEAGWWWTETVFASVKRESHVYVLFNLKSSCLLTNCCCRHQVRSCFRSLLKNTQRLPCSRTCFFIFLRLPCCPTGMDAISVPLKNAADMHSGYEVCQSKVCGDRCADLYTKLLWEILTHARRHMTHIFYSLTHSLTRSLSHATFLQHCVTVHSYCLQFLNEKKQCPRSDRNHITCFDRSQLKFTIWFLDCYK